MKIALIGMRGAGKSTVGRALADALGAPFADSDDVVEARTGRTIPDLFEAGTFREEERAVVAELLAGDGVVALGGGAVLDPTFDAHAQGWQIVLLEAAPEVLAQRIRDSGAPRPSLTGADPAAEVNEVWAARRIRYQALAHFSAATDTLDVGGVVAAILARLQNAER